MCTHACTCEQHVSIGAGVGKEAYIIAEESDEAELKAWL